MYHLLGLCLSRFKCYCCIVCWGLSSFWVCPHPNLSPPPPPTSSSTIFLPPLPTLGPTAAAMAPGGAGTPPGPSVPNWLDSESMLSLLKLDHQICESQHPRSAVQLCSDSMSGSITCFSTPNAVLLSMQGPRTSLKDRHANQLTCPRAALAE